MNNIPQTKENENDFILRSLSYISICSKLKNHVYYNNNTKNR
jgi:hypothetical protein